MFDEDEEDVLTSAEIRCVVASAGAQCLAELKVNEYLRLSGGRELLLNWLSSNKVRRAIAIACAVAALLRLRALEIGLVALAIAGAAAVWTVPRRTKVDAFESCTSRDAKAAWTL